MNESPFLKFIDLINVDQLIEAHNKNIKRLEQENLLMQEKEQKAAQELAALQRALYDAQKAVDMQELDMKELDAQEREKKQRLDLISNHKEYQSLKAEIDQLKKKQHVLEESLLKAWHYLEIKKKEFEIKYQEVETDMQLVRDTMLKTAEQSTQLSKQVDELTIERAQKEFGVPAEWLEKYALMRSQVSDPVVPVVQGACSACFYKVLEQDLVQLRRNKLLQCKDCYRFLYIESPDMKLTNEAA